MRRRALSASALVLSTAVTLAVAPASVAYAQDPAPAAEEGAEAPAEKAVWEYPRELSAGGVRLTIHEPSVMEYGREDGSISLRIPAEVTDAVGRSSWGSLDVTGVAHIDFNSRVIAVDGLALAKAALPGLDEELAAKATEDLPTKLPAELQLRLELLTDRPGAAPAEEAPFGRVSTRPPEVIVRRQETLLIQIDGEPAMEQVESFPLHYVSNTAADIFHDQRDKRWLLIVDGHWAAAAAIEGPYEWFDGKLPIVLTQLPVDHPRGHVRRFVPGTRRYNNRVGKTPPVRPAELPEIIVAKKPTELVLLHGDPLFTLIPGVKLMTVANSSSDILFHPKSGTYFLLISGRWFQSEEIDGPWAEHYGALPEEFAKIPRDHVRAHMLWCVPGTPEAAEAAARATLPQRVSLHQRIQARVRYENGDMVTSPIEKVEYRGVTNSEDYVFHVGGAYFVCLRGAWLRSDTGKGMWAPIETLPEALATIPESTGAYHVSTCRPLGKVDKAFRFQVQGPYLGVYLHKGAPTHGNGWDRRGLSRNGNWYPMARTYGENRWYDPMAGVFRPRNVLYGEDGLARATEWSVYTASYGRTRWYSDRYLQGGRRMFPYDLDKDEFDTSAPRPDVYQPWAEDVLERDGLPVERFPLGDRTKETSPEGPPIVADAEGVVFRQGEKGVETFSGGAWIPAPTASGDVKARLAALARVQRLADDLRAWSAKRRAPLPVNPVITPR